MSCMLVEKGIEHGLLHLNGMDNWKYMRCGGSCSNCGDVDPGRATGMAKRAFQDYKARLERLEDHDTSTSDSLPAEEAIVCVTWTQERYPGQGPPQSSESHLQFSQVQLGGHQVGLLLPPAQHRSPLHKDPKVFQPLKLSAQSTATPLVQPVVGTITGPIAPKQKAMPTKRGDTIMGYQDLFRLASVVDAIEDHLCGAPESAKDQAKIKRWRA